MKWSAEEAVPGDIVRVKTGVIYHYGIYVSDDEVIQFGLPPTPERLAQEVKVLSSSVEEFLGGGFLEVGCPEGAEKRRKKSAEAIVTCARSRIGEGGYDFLHNNCEHFAFECAFGVKYSSQTDALREKVRAIPIVDVYIAKIPLSFGGDEIYPPARLKEIESCTDEAVKLQKLNVWKLLGYGLERTFGLNITNLKFKKPNGKWTCPDCEFSLSHCRDVVAVVLSRKCVGVDVEEINPARFAAVGDKILTDGEKSSLANLDDGDYSRAVNAIWTKKEAEFKRIGGKAFIPRKVDTVGVKFAEKVISDGDREYFITVSSADADRAVFRIKGQGVTLK